MAQDYAWFTLLVIACCIQINSATFPFFWNRLFPTTTSSSVTTTTVNSSAVGNYSETYNGNNNNVQSYPLIFTQNGSRVNGSAVGTLDQYLGDIKVNVSKRSIEKIPIKTVVKDYYQPHIQKIPQNFLHVIPEFYNVDD